MWTIEKLVDNRPFKQTAAQWFHEKWKVPLEAYLESMEDSFTADSGVPQWYLALDEGRIVGGLGVIENDFHKRKDLAPNICAVYVDEAYRRQGMARAMMDRVCRDLAEKGVKDVYLITTHTEFYEHCGFDFYGMIEEDEGDMVRMYHRQCE